MEFSYTTKRILRHTFTGKDRSTVDIGRILWAVGVIAFLVISAVMAWRTGTFDPLAWGSGFALVNGGSGAAIKMKETTEPAA